MDNETTDAGLVDAMTRAVGFRPLDAFVALPYCEFDDGPLVVADVPSGTGSATLRRFSTVVTAAATRQICADSVFVVLYTSQPFGEPPRPAGFDLVFAACAKMHRSGLHPMGLFCVATDGWGEYSLTGESGPRFERRPLADLTALPVREL